MESGSSIASHYSPQYCGHGLGWVEQDDVLWLWGADCKQHGIRVGCRLTFKGKRIVLTKRFGATHGRWRGFRWEVE